MIGKLNSCHHMCSRFITGRHIKLIGEERVYPSTEDSLKKAKLLTIEEYLSKRKNIVKKYALSTNIFQQCQSLKGTSTSWKKLTWWENIVRDADYSGSDLPLVHREIVDGWETTTVVLLTQVVALTHGSHTGRFIN
jgi:hypothetical protein